MEDEGWGSCLWSGLGSRVKLRSLDIILDHSLRSLLDTLAQDLWRGMGLSVVSVSDAVVLVEVRTRDAWGFGTCFEGLFVNIPRAVL